MKVILLAGGLGTRLAEHTETRPKPMIEIGRYPILWHIMGIYAAYGCNDFIVACGYKGEVFKQYFDTFFIHHSDYTVNLRDGAKQVVSSHAPDWQVTLVDTGVQTMT